MMRDVQARDAEVLGLCQLVLEGLVVGVPREQRLEQQPARDLEQTDSDDHAQQRHGGVGAQTARPRHARRPMRMKNPPSPPWLAIQRSCEITESSFDPRSWRS